MIRFQLQGNHPWLLGVFLVFSITYAACGDEDPMAPQVGCDGGKCDSFEECATEPQTAVGRAYEVTFDVSTYNIPYTWRLGEHQGIGSRQVVTEVELVWSETPVEEDGEVRCAVTVESEEWTEQELTPQRQIIRTWNNHGRTVSYQPSEESPHGQCFTTLHSADLRPELWEEIDPGGNPIASVEAQAQQVHQCIARIPDGPCDSFCGSCRYCLPFGIIGLSNCYDHEEGLTEQMAGGHNSNNDARMVLALWRHCTEEGEFPDASDGPWIARCRELCGGEGQSNRATTSGIPGETADPDYHSDGECNDDFPEVEDDCDAKSSQPECVLSGNSVCGFG